MFTVCVFVCVSVRGRHRAIIPSDRSIGDSVSISEVPLYALQTELSSRPRLRFCFLLVCRKPLKLTCCSFFCFEFMLFLCFVVFCFFVFRGGGLLPQHHEHHHHHHWTVVKLCLECGHHTAGHGCEELTAHRPAWFPWLSLPLHHNTPTSLSVSSSLFLCLNVVGRPVAL